mmetsp:Transcript_3896/g.17207  ORF Transcript_3896/g.17207 Transcript_3896/m.17207 type:complete len:224 (+) Transcript_3896:141-812(+)
MSAAPGVDKSINSLFVLEEQPEDALSEGAVLDQRQVRPDPVHQLGVQRTLRDAQRGLHHVVTVRVHQKPVEQRRRHNLADHDVAVLLERGVCELKALLHDVGRELLHRELGVVTRESHHDLGVGPRQGQVQDVLNHVVAKGILRQHERLSGDLLHERASLAIGGVVDAPLQDAASVPVRGNLHAALSRGVVDKLVIFGAQALEAPLNDVVPVEVLDEGDDAWL